MRSCLERIKLLVQIKNYNEENGYPIEDDSLIFWRIFKGEICECTERCFAGRLAKYCKKAGIASKSPHDARRTALTNMYKMDVDIKVIQKIAGHETQKQTEDYIHLVDITAEESTEKLVEVAEVIPSNIIKFKKNA